MALAGAPAQSGIRPAEVKNRGEKSDHFDFLEWEKGREAHLDGPGTCRNYHKMER